MADKYPFYEPISFDLEKIDDLERICIDDMEEDLDEIIPSYQLHDELLTDNTEAEAELDDFAEKEYQEKDAFKKHQTQVSESYFLFPENLPGEISYKSEADKSYLFLLQGRTKSL